MGPHADKLFDQVAMSSSHSDADSRRPCADGNGEGMALLNPTLVTWHGNLDHQVWASVEGLGTLPNISLVAPSSHPLHARGRLTRYLCGEGSSLDPTECLFRRALSRHSGMQLSSPAAASLRLHSFRESTEMLSHEPSIVCDGFAVQYPSR